jgi:Ca2+-binding EF-hand superfamily protein
LVHAVVSQRGRERRPSISFEESQANFHLSLEQPVKEENDRGAEAFLFDRDKDGAISPDEFSASCAKFFAILDKDRDGQITLAEVRSSRRGALASR